MLTEPEPFADALETLRRKLPAPSKLNSRRWALQAEQVRERSFFSARVESLRFLARARAFILDFLEREREETPGGIALKADGRARFVRDMARLAIQEGLGPVGIPADKIDHDSLSDIRSEARLKLIFDTQTKQAVGYGWWEQGMDPDTLNEWPAARFVRHPGAEEKRPRHAAYEGAVRLKRDRDFWAVYQNDPEIGGFGVPWPPYGFNSKMDQEDVSREEAVALGLIGKDEPIKGERGRPKFNEGLRASVRGLDPDLRRKLAQELGIRTPLSIDEIKRPKRGFKRGDGGD